MWLLRLMPVRISPVYQRRGSCLWLLSRTPTVDQKLLTRFVDQAKQLGFATENLIYPRQQ